MKQVLIVDDTVENLQVLMEALRSEYAIVTAKNGEKALELAMNKPRPDIILLDIMMPGMNGYEVCEKLKADVRTKDIPVIFITVLMEEEDEARGLALGAVDYIVKPFCPALVKARVKNQLDLKEHQDNLERLVKERTKELALVKKVTIECLATMAEWRDPETGGHIARTQNYVKILAEHAMEQEEFASQLDEELIETLYLSAPLHDVGKVGVADAILLKPGKLTAEEFEEMKKHSQFGSDALAGAEKALGGNSFLHHAREIAFAHHEKWDGSGYPRGISGEDIPLSARIMAIADVYDALISKRVYKEPFPHSKAVKIISEGRSGTHFDPRLTDIFLKIQEEFREIALEFADFDEERKTLKK
ncbi:HD domain-containing phosphohydrolase [Maridesulfovibrio sp.]|uniref:HD domain-containing phosphohydrolase n=1 Tax=Maridesulfovibrio sp. TaxID=2795000 RepID=UPI0029CA8B7E|nr:HD domain-containing phosphohydrolase [Maridesulfovibrio sp.]